MSSEASRQQHRDNHRSSPTTRTPTKTKARRLALLAILTAIFAVLIALFYGDSDNLFGFRSLFGPSSFIARSVGGGLSKSDFASAFTSAGTAAAAAAASAQKAPVHPQQSERSSFKMNTNKTPVYFLSHGGVSEPFIRYLLPFSFSTTYFLSYPESEYTILTIPAEHNVRHRTPGLPQTRRNRSRNHAQGQTTRRGGFLGALAGRTGYDPCEYGRDDGFDL